MATADLIDECDYAKLALEDVMSCPALGLTYPKQMKGNVRVSFLLISYNELS
jgi:hypothetical protein